MNMPKYIGLLLALVVTFAAGKAKAVNLIGNQLFYTGGNLHIENLPADSGFDNYMYLRTPLDGDKFLFIDNGDQQVTFTQGELLSFGVDVGDELLFMMLPDNTTPAFFTGPADRNPDNLIHAQIFSLGDGWFRVGFEDLLGGGDADFNDAQFNVPEPSTLTLLALGLIGFRLRRFSGAKNSH